MRTTCALCSTPVQKSSAAEGGLLFCCIGCKTVHQILSSQNAVGHYADTAIFKEAVATGLIANPLLLEEIRAQELQLADEETRLLHLEILQMWCPSCAEIIRLILLKHKGIKNCLVDYTTDMACIEYCPKYLSKEQIFRIIQASGYAVCPWQEAGEEKDDRSLYLRAIIAGFCAFNIMMFAYPVYASYFFAVDEGYAELFGWLSFALSLPVIVCGWPIWQRAWHGLRVGVLGMELLVAISVFAAFILSCFELLQASPQLYFDTLSVIVAFLLTGKILEARAKFAAKKAIRNLRRVLPKRGRKLFPDGRQAFVPLDEIEKGDSLAVLPGELLVLDGTVLEGEGECDEALITGEVQPVAKIPGAKVIGGSRLLQGRLVVQAEASVETSTLSRIIELVQEGLRHKAAAAGLAEKSLRWFVPLVVALALLALLLFMPLGKEEAIVRCLSVLLIACPCAIGLAAPLAESQTLNRLAAAGIIVKNRAVLPLLGKEQVVVFDKTGTITDGSFTWQKEGSELTAGQLKILKGLASVSSHLAAQAIARAIEGPSAAINGIEECAGKGVKGWVSDQPCYLGSHAFMQELGIAIKPEDESLLLSGHTLLFFAVEAMPPVALRAGDRLRDEIPDLLKQLNSIKTILLSGDLAAVVKQAAAKAGIIEWHAECSPRQKQQFIEDLQQRHAVVCFIGDGINDAPSLAAASIGISVMNASEMAVQVSDLLFTTPNLHLFLLARKIAVEGQKRIRQNLFWAWIYNLLGLPLAFFGFLNPIYAASAMILSSLIVVVNSQRKVDFSL